MLESTRDGRNAFKLNGVLVYFAAFKKHIGFYDEPIPYDLIERIVKLRVKQNLAKAPVRER